MTERIRGHAWVIWRSLVLQLRETARSPMAFVVAVVQPATLLGLVLLAQPPTDAAINAATIVGTMAIALWSVTLWAAGSVLHREISYGTMAAILSRPVSLTTVLIGKSLGVAVFGLGAITSTTAVILIAAGPQLTYPGPETIVVIALLATVSACTLGVLLSSLLVIARGSPRVIEALIYPVFVLGGLLIPVDLLPDFLRWPANLISLHFVVNLATSPHPVEIAWILVLCGLYLAVGRIAMESLLRRGRERGNLEFS